jgi:hypothetical protein
MPVYLCMDSDNVAFYSICTVQCRYLGAIGGKDLTESTRRILRSVKTNSVARQMNFAGRGGKKALRDMRLLQVIIGNKAVVLIFPKVFKCLFIFKICTQYIYIYIYLNKC